MLSSLPTYEEPTGNIRFLISRVIKTIWSHWQPYKRKETRTIKRLAISGTCIFTQFWWSATLVTEVTKM